TPASSRRRSADVADLAIASSSVTTSHGPDPARLADRSAAPRLPQLSPQRKTGEKPAGSRPGQVTRPGAWSRSSVPKQLAQAPGVADRVPVPVVVEVRVHLASRGRPLLDPVGPPAQVVLAVGAGVQ